MGESRKVKGVVNMKRKNTLFKDVSLDWIEWKSTYIKESTYNYYLYELETYINPSIGENPIIQVGNTHIQNAVCEWEKRLSTGTIKNLVMVIASVLSYAKQNGLTIDCNFNVAYKGSSFQQPCKVYGHYEQLAISDALMKSTDYRTLGIALALYEGMRIGEICALRWSDIDFEKSIIHVNKTLQRLYLPEGDLKTKLVIQTAKTRHSNRDIPISTPMLKLLRKFETPKSVGYVTSCSEKLIEPRNLRRYYQGFISNLHIAPLKFHALRHTFATTCIENGGDYKIVGDLLGHANISTTINLYVHPRWEEKMKTIELACENTQ